MKVAVIGSGAREHALAWAFSRSHRIHGLACLPGNAGMAEIADILAVDPMDNPGTTASLQAWGADLVFIGPEAPLENGLADALREGGLRVVGPGKKATRLESSKAFSKEFLLRNNIPTARSVTLSRAKEVDRALTRFSPPWVLKKSGLAAGKGVFETSHVDEARRFAQGVLQSDVLLLEEYLHGFEISVFVLLDGENHLVLPACADHKKAFEGDTGLNTGGMGSICPVPLLSQALWSEVEKSVIAPVLEGLRKDKLMFPGVLFIGLMVTQEGPKVLEFNVRFGDPETQALLPRIRNDFADIAEAMVNGTLDKVTLEIDPAMTLSVVVASPGYPGPYPKSLSVGGLPQNRPGKFVLFHAGTERSEAGELVTTGGRCFSAVGIGEVFDDAQRRANQGAAEVAFEGAWFRKDIGKKMIELGVS